jgi:hypothetical protein
VSAVAEPDRSAALPPAWERLERAAYGAADALLHWRRRALEAEAEVARLRRVLEQVAGEPSSASAQGDEGEEARRLRAENALLVSRAAEARRRISGLIARLAVLESRR